MNEDDPDQLAQLQSLSCRLYADIDRLKHDRDKLRDENERLRTRATYIQNIVDLVLSSYACLVKCRKDTKEFSKYINKIANSPRLREKSNI